jgi:hypothetical protein
MPADAIPGWAYKVLAKSDVSLKQAAWSYGCAKKGSEEERLLLERLWQVIRAAIPARDTEWREAVLASQHGTTHYAGCGCEPLRKLLEETRRG